MNALWITRMSTYKNSSLCVLTSRKVIAIKIAQESVLLKKYKKSPLKTSILNREFITDILLEEGRMARKFWMEFKNLLPLYTDFVSRKHRSADAVNHLLNIGYHHLTNIVRKILSKYNIPMDLGLIHVARNTDSSPLAYDLVEMFRSDIVDAEVLKFLRLKKKKIDRVDKHIAHFVYQINKRLQKKHFLKDFGQCHTYEYYMELQILKFIKAINHREVFQPIHLPKRHENRCS